VTSCLVMCNVVIRGKDGVTYRRLHVLRQTVGINRTNDPE